ncbi:HesA/MoeB/ThiF family protein [Mycobacterium sherrisii]|uniref:HesA/MoeB/ThiF family protein n=1 Tax=Mycobacterium sherrisii TaxID=243061 RepID=UPI003976CC85
MTARPTRFALSEDQFAALAAALDTSEETAAVIAATMLTMPTSAERTGGVTLLARSLTWIPEQAYLERHALGLSITSAGWIPPFRGAIKDACVPVFVHTHPGGRAAFSPYDDLVDASLAAVARDLGATAYASIVVAGWSDTPSVIARMCLFNQLDMCTDRDSVDDNAVAPEFVIVDAVRVAGHALQLMLPVDYDGADDAEDAANDGDRCDAFDRQVRMLGRRGQQTLGAVNVAVIGAGGTGSAVAVQLARMGIGSICLVDDDVVTPPTPTRGHGMRVADLGRSKVAALGSHLREIGFGTNVVEVNSALHSPEALQALQSVDVVFSCVDGHGARLILNRYAYAHLAVVIDLAVLVTVAAIGTEIDQRVTWIGPGTACLLCRGRLDAALAYAENLDPETRKQLAGEGYVEAAHTPQPAVVSLTTMIAALGVTEFLLRLAGIGSTEATELLLRPHVGELRRNRIGQRPGCFCSDPKYLGRGRQQPYLDLMWPEPPLTAPGHNRSL